MSYEFYKVLHLVGLVTLFTALGALAFVPADRRKPLMMIHGIATVVMLVAGFGLLARLGLIGSLGAWVYGKLAIWLVMGAAPVVLRRKPDMALTLLLVSIALGAVSAFLAIYKPGA